MQAEFTFHYKGIHKDGIHYGLLTDNVLAMEEKNNIHEWNHIYPAHTVEAYTKQELLEIILNNADNGEKILCTALDGKKTLIRKGETGKAIVLSTKN